MPFQRILIVEDEMLVAMDLEAILMDYGHNPVGIAPDSKTALEMGHQMPDVAFVDINLRDGPTGIDVGRQLAETFGIKVIYTSANPRLLGAGVAGCVGVLPKPYRPEQVLEALRFLSQRAKGNPRATPPHALSLFASASQAN